MKQRILTTAAVAMNERGVKFTVDSVAIELGISKKTLYQYYKSKDDLIGAIIEAALEDMRQQQRQVLSMEASLISRLEALLVIEPKQFGKVNDWVLDDIRRFRPAEWEKIQLFRLEKKALIEGVLAEGIQQGMIREINTKLAAHMLIASCGEFLQYPVMLEHNLSFSEALKLVTDLFLHGVIKEGGV